jgi:hypothetical protein
MRPEVEATSGRSVITVSTLPSGCTSSLPSTFCAGPRPPNGRRKITILKSSVRCTDPLNSPNDVCTEAAPIALASGQACASSAVRVQSSASKPGLNPNDGG